MQNSKTVPQGISVIYFKDENKSVHADLPLTKEHAKKLSRRIYWDAMRNISKVTII